ncbi:hypothetical protein CDAR_552921 [Caerostris darwini]|uniref:Uncharacterized protein n=1 Tax=Caerostris darwini TaxID=1538125 RepID=A0AAV4WB84_9ARAC|nr:hypothetical protein CDAR_552921 [Caerostris darwini]
MSTIYGIALLKIGEEGIAFLMTFRERLINMCMNFVILPTVDGATSAESISDVSATDKKWPLVFAFIDVQDSIHIKKCYCELIIV